MTGRVIAMSCVICLVAPGDMESHGHVLCHLPVAPGDRESHCHVLCHLPGGAW